MSTKAHVSEIPQCSLCKMQHIDPPKPAYADARIDSISTWAYVCEEHFKEYKCQLGTGLGQELTTEPEEKDQTERIKGNLKDADFENMSYEDFEELFEDRDPAEFL